MPRIDVDSYIGKTINTYLILKFSHFTNYKHSRQAFFLIRCKCNREYIKGIWDIKKHSNCIKCRNNGTLPNSEAQKNQIYNQYLRNAEKRDYEFTISKTDFLKLLEGNCYYCNSKNSNISTNLYTKNKYYYNGIDRFDNTKGYTIDNCVSSCNICNRWKSNMTEKEFINHVMKIKTEYE